MHLIAAYAVLALLSAAVCFRQLLYLQKMCYGPRSTGMYCCYRSVRDPRSLYNTNVHARGRKKRAAHAQGA